MPQAGRLHRRPDPLPLWPAHRLLVPL